MEIKGESKEIAIIVVALNHLIGYLISMNTQSQTRLEYVITSLRAAMPKNWEQIAQDTGVSISAIRKIAYRETKHPRCDTLEPLLDYFLQAEREAVERRTFTDR